MNDGFASLRSEFIQYRAIVVEDLIRQRWAHRAFFTILLDNYANEEPQVPESRSGANARLHRYQRPNGDDEVRPRAASGPQGERRGNTEGARIRGSQMNLVALKEALKRYGYNLKMTRLRRTSVSPTNIPRRRRVHGVRIPSSAGGGAMLLG